MTDNNTTVYTQEDLDNGIFLVDIDRYNNDRSFRISINKIFYSHPDGLTVWMVSYDGEGKLYDYDGASLAMVQKNLDEGLVIATKEEYLRAQGIHEEELARIAPVDPGQKETFQRLLDIWVEKEGKA